MCPGTKISPMDAGPWDSKAGNSPLWLSGRQRRIWIVSRSGKGEKSPEAGGTAPDSGPAGIAGDCDFSAACRGKARQAGSGA